MTKEKVLVAASWYTKGASACFLTQKGASTHFMTGKVPQLTSWYKKVPYSLHDGKEKVLVLNS